MAPSTGTGSHFSFLSPLMVPSTGAGLHGHSSFFGHALFLVFEPLINIQDMHHSSFLSPLMVPSTGTGLKGHSSFLGGLASLPFWGFGPLGSPRHRPGSWQSPATMLAGAIPGADRTISGLWIQLQRRFVAQTSDFQRRRGTSCEVTQRWTLGATLITLP